MRYTNFISNCLGQPMVCGTYFDAWVNNFLLYVYLNKNMSEQGFVKLSKHTTSNCLPEMELTAVIYDSFV